jgi:hypothetical protein
MVISAFGRYSQKDLTADRRGWTQIDAEGYECSEIDEVRTYIL